MANRNSSIHSDCPDQDQLQRFGRGALTGDRMLSLSQHLDQCPACCAVLSAYDDGGDPLISALRDQSIEQCESDVHWADQTARECFEFDSARDDTSIQSATDTDQRSGELIPAIANYEVRRLIGRGGMGAVYSAVHLSLDRPVAIKVLSPTRQGDATATVRFRAEMKAVGRVNHPNIVQALDAGQSDRVLYLAMELIAGLNLSDLLRRGGPLGQADACEIVRQAALGLHHAHEQELTHRDIKPSNLMLALQSEIRLPDGFDCTCERISPDHRNWVSRQTVSLKVTDLGLSLHGDLGADEALTHSGQMMGTIEYMAPEQIQDARRVDRRADIYSLGASLYRMLSGQVPFAHLGHAVTLKKLNAIAEGQFVPLEHVHPGLAPEVYEFVDRLMENDRRSRFQSMAEVAAAAASLCRGADLPGLLAHRWSLQPDQRDSIEWSTHNQKMLSDTESKIAHHNGYAWETHQSAKSGFGFRRRRGLLLGCLFLVLMTGLGFIAAGPFSRLGDTGRAPNASAPGLDVEPSDALRNSLPGNSASDTWSHLPADAPRPAIAPFDPAQAASFQREWAEYLGSDVTRTVALPSGQSFQMQLLPPGQFQMGTSDAEKAEVLERTVDFKGFIAALLTFEGPKRTAFVENPVWMGRQEITIGLFREFVSATGYVTDAERQGGSEGMYLGATAFRADFLWNDSADRELNELEPVTSVSYDDANAFCSWLSDQVPDSSFQLPTERQWEYACRGGVDSVYLHGRDLDELAKYEWFRINSGSRMHVGGQLKANPFGLFDLQGNATEWCRDVFQRGSASQSDSDEVTGDVQSVRVMRGGYWGSSIESARPGIRQPRERSLGHHQMGFRVVSEIALDQTLQN